MFIKLFEAGHPLGLQTAEALRPLLGSHESHDVRVMDFARWHLIRLQRFCVPTRVAETVEDLEWIVAHQKQKKKLKTDGWVCSA
jgi:hypothetical protein